MTIVGIDEVEQNFALLNDKDQQRYTVPKQTLLGAMGVASVDELVDCLPFRIVCSIRYDRISTIR